MTTAKSERKSPSLWQETLPSATAFPSALGCGILLHTRASLKLSVVSRIQALIEDMDHTLSRFRHDSLVSCFAHAPQGTTAEFPNWCLPLFDLYDVLATASDGRFDPCIGADLVALGYSTTFDMMPADDDAATISTATPAGAIRRRAWRTDVRRNGTTLRTDRPVQLDFGACGKGLCVDLIATILEDAGADAYVVDAGGDLRISLGHANQDAMSIALENPEQLREAVGVASLAEGSLCASAPSRRHWTTASGTKAHHILDAMTGQPVDELLASWAMATRQHSPFPTMLADAAATALFVTPANMLRKRLQFECAYESADRRLFASSGFPASFFTRRDGGQ